MFFEGSCSAANISITLSLGSKLYSRLVWQMTALNWHSTLMVFGAAKLDENIFLHFHLRQIEKCNSFIRVFT